MAGNYSYPLGAKILSEFVAMASTIFLGESILANELLPSTKGHGMGFLAVAFGFGLAFGVNIAWFGFISAHINPGMFLFLALLGKVSWTEAVACSFADFCGAFVGAVLVVIFWFPHFGFALPLPSDTSDVATYMEGPVSLDKNAGRLCSAFGPASRQREGGTLLEEWRTFYYSPYDDGRANETEREGDSVRQALLDKMEMSHQRRVAATHAHHLHGSAHLRRPSIQVADLLHAHDPAFISHSIADGDIPDRIRTREDPGNSLKRRHSAQVAGLLHTHDGGFEQVIAKLKSEKQLNTDASSSSATYGDGEARPEIAGPDKSLTTNNKGDEEGQEQQRSDLEKVQQARDHESIAMASYKAALEADASAKLSIFATRPAIYNRLHNFLQEMMLSAALILGAEMFNLRREYQSELTGTPIPDGPLFQSFYVAMYIAMLVLGVGGPTGLAANPARDLGPRLAHQLLPLPGKGSSEWRYGLVVPLWGPLAGSCLAAAIYIGLEALFDMVEVVPAGDSGAGEL